MNKKTVNILALIVSGILLLLVASVAVLYVRHELISLKKGNRSLKNVEIETSTSITGGLDFGSFAKEGSIFDSVYRDKIHWYDSLEEALEDKTIITKNESGDYDDYDDLMNKLVFKSENGEYIDLFYKGPHEPEINGMDSYDTISAVSVKIKDGKYATPFILYRVADKEEWPGYSYDILDITALNFLGEYDNYDMFGGRDYNHLWFGVSDNLEDVKQLRIAGEPVNEIITVQFESGEIGYFWYFDKSNPLRYIKNIDRRWKFGELEEAMQLTLEGAEES